MSEHIAIVGGGIIGMLTAYFLAEQGHSPILLDKGQLAKESSWAGGGILSPLYPWRYAEEISQLSAYGQQHYQSLCQDLYDKTGIDPEWIQSGLLTPNLDELEHAQQWAKQYKSELQIIDNRADLDAIEAELHPQFESALWMSEIAQLRNPRLLKALKCRLEQMKVEIQTHTTMLDIKQGKNQQVTAILTEKGTLAVDRVILCTGAWSGQLNALKNTPLNVKPVSGEMILFKAAPQQLKRIILHQGRYLIPRQDGRILCGSSLAFTQFDKQIHAKTKQSLQQTAYQLAPFLKHVNIEHHWCGLRPASPNGIPYIDEHPEIQNLYINTGHYRYGVTMGLGSVKLLLDKLMGKTSFLDINHFSLSRERPASYEFLENN
jgi:glycine oxidase